jgi:hypothetical protein
MNEQELDGMNEQELDGLLGKHINNLIQEIINDTKNLLLLKGIIIDDTTLNKAMIALSSNIVKTLIFEMIKLNSVIDDRITKLEEELENQKIKDVLYKN